MIGIYKITNLVNGKVYIGQSRDLHRRYLTHLRELRQRKHINYHLQNAWNKYGENNFKFEIIEECLEKQLNDKETYWFNYYKPNVYNLGNTGNVQTASDETKNKISNSLKGLVRSSNAIANMRKAKKGAKPNDIALQHSVETNSRKIIQTDMDCNYIKEWISIAEASRYMGCSPSNINAVLQNKSNKIKGFRWFYKEDYESGKCFEMVKAQKKRWEERNKKASASISKKVIQYTKEMIKIKEWSSMTIASKELNIFVSTISACCHHTKKTAGGYIWRIKK